MSGITRLWRTWN